jgi:hypothetical protein
MNIEVYCDETYPDLFSSENPQAQYMFIGSLWLASESRETFKTEIHALRDRYKIGGEFKWTKVSPSREEFYKALIEWFCSQGETLRFRCIAIEHEKVNLIPFHNGDHELGFYKFYYQMLHHWIYSCNTYKVFCDFKSNRSRDRLHTLQRCLQYANLSANIQSVQSVRSPESVLIQLADVLLGAASAKFNRKLAAGSAKERVTLHLEKLLRHPISPTRLAEKKFNFFKIDLSGGW